MVKMILHIDGMACNMCESHVNNLIRNAFAVKKVHSAHRKGITEIIAEAEIQKAALQAELEKAGYNIMAMETTPHEKKGLFRK